MGEYEPISACHDTLQWSDEVSLSALGSTSTVKFDVVDWVVDRGVDWGVDRVVAHPNSSGLNLGLESGP